MVRWDDLSPAEITVLETVFWSSGVSRSELAGTIRLLAQQGQHGDGGVDRAWACSLKGSASHSFWLNLEPDRSTDHPN